MREVPLMGLEAVVERIRQQGEAEASRILAEARQEAERLVTEARAAAQKLVAAREQEAARVAKRRHTQELARAELEARRVQLLAQKEALDAVYRHALTRLATWPGATKLVQELLRRHDGEVKSGRVFCPPAQAAVVKSLFPKVTPEPLDAAGGFVVESADGTTRLDLRFETLLQGTWEDAVKDVAGVLWKEG